MIDVNQIMKLLNDPNVRNLVQGLIGQLTKGQGGQANLSGLMDQLSQHGLGDQVQSWVGTGQNQPVSPDQLQQALGEGTLDQVAAQAGTSPQEAAESLSQVLPQLVDSATPSGQMPGPQDLQQLLAVLSGQQSTNV